MWLCHINMSCLGGEYSHFRLCSCTPISAQQKGKVGKERSDERQAVAGMGSSADRSEVTWVDTRQKPHKAVYTRSLRERLQAWGPAVASPRILVAEGIGPSYLQPNERNTGILYKGHSKKNKTKKNRSACEVPCWRELCIHWMKILLRKCKTTIGKLDFSIKMLWFK